MSSVLYWMSTEFFRFIFVLLFFFLFGQNTRNMTKREMKSKIICVSTLLSFSHFHSKVNHSTYTVIRCDKSSFSIHSLAFFLFSFISLFSVLFCFVSLSFYVYRLFIHSWNRSVHLFIHLLFLFCFLRKSKTEKKILFFHEKKWIRTGIKSLKLTCNEGT